MKEIYLAGGCFWGTEAYYKKIKGIITTEVGYANGPSDEVTYKEVCNSSGHVEVVKLTFNESVLSIEELFNSFIRVIDPYSLNKQGEDIGVQYRTGIYSKDDELLLKMKQVVSNWENKNKKSKIEILPLTNYVKAEKEHQDYLTNNPTGFCHINLMTIPKNLLKG